MSNPKPLPSQPGIGQHQNPRGSPLTVGRMRHSMRKLSYSWPQWRQETSVEVAGGLKGSESESKRSWLAIARRGPLETKTPQRVSQMDRRSRQAGLEALTPQDASFLVLRPEITLCGCFQCIAAEGNCKLGVAVFLTRSEQGFNGWRDRKFDNHCDEERGEQEMRELRRFGVQVGATRCEDLS
jgi:hypothetical protein